MEVASALKNITKMFVFTHNFCLHSISREDIVFLKPCGNKKFLPFLSAQITEIITLNTQLIITKLNKAK
jgi:hypothetical protein